MDLFNRAKEVLFKLPLAVLAEDENRKISFANQYFCDLFAIDVEPEMLSGMDCGGLAEQSKGYFKNPDTFVNYVNQAISVHEPIHDVELELIDGRYLSATYVPYFQDKTFAGHIWTYKEITKRKEAEEELRLSELKYKTVVNHLQEVVFRIDAQGIIHFLNPAWEIITGHKINQSLGKKITDFADQAYSTDIEQSIKDLFSGKKTSDATLLKIINKNKIPVYLEVYASTMVLEEGQKVIWGTLTNVTEKKKAEFELLKGIQKERELFDLKSRFVNMVSHEIRTPMAGILSSVELLELINQGDPAEAVNKSKKHYHRIKSQIKRVTDLMNDVLLLGKFDAGKVTFHPQMVNLVSLIKELIDQNFNPQSSGRKINILTEGTKRACQVDPELFKHMVANLLSNALKYSVGQADPEIKIIFGEKNLVLEVSDHGIGIPEKDKKNLFAAFIRASNTRNIEGTGLGLVIIKHFVDIHQGNITFESSENKGSTFTITLPG